MKADENNNPTTIAEDAAIAAASHIEEQLGLTVAEALLVIEIIEAAVEAALELQRRRMLKAEEN